MAAMRVSSMITRNIFSSASLSSLKSAPAMMFPDLGVVFGRVPHAMTISCSPVVRSAAEDGFSKKSPARLSQIQQMLHQVVERSQSAGNEPIPKITANHVVMRFSRSGGPGGQNVNISKVDMRFNIKDAQWLSDRVRERIMQVEKNRINKDGEIVISSTKTRTQKGNIEDALGKL